MRALTIHQPWASLIAIGAKRIETRSWSTSYQGPLAIHAAAGKPEMFDHQRGWIGSGGYISQLMMGKWADEIVHAEPCDCDHDEEIAGDRCMAGSDWSYAVLKDEGAHGVSLATKCPLGVIVATCELVDVVRIGGNGRHDRVYPRVHRWNDGVIGLCREPDEVADFSIGQERPFGDFTPGRFAWLLDNVTPLDEPIPARGQQGLWTWEPAA